MHGTWLETNEIDANHLLIKHEKTPTTKIQYFQNGERKETPVFGSDHYRLMEAVPEEIDSALHGRVKGVYIFKEADLEFWKAVGDMKREHGFTLLWEINARSAKHALINDVKQIGESVGKR